MRPRTAWLLVVGFTLTFWGGLIAVGIYLYRAFCGGHHNPFC